MSELLTGPPLRLGDVTARAGALRLTARLMTEDGVEAAFVFAGDDALPSVLANALLLMGAARCFRALRELLAASRGMAAEDPLAPGARAIERLRRAEAEAEAALAAATYTPERGRVS